MKVAKNNPDTNVSKITLTLIYVFCTSAPCSVAAVHAELRAGASAADIPGVCSVPAGKHGTNQKCKVYSSTDNDNSTY